MTDGERGQVLTPGCLKFDSDELPHAALAEGARFCDEVAADAVRICTTGAVRVRRNAPVDRRGSVRFRHPLPAVLGIPDEPLIRRIDPEIKHFQRNLAQQRLFALLQ